MTNNRLYRSESDKMIAGVCGGISEVYDLDPSLVRIAVILLTLFTSGTFLVVYILAWLIIPHESELAQEEVEIGEE